MMLIGRAQGVMDLRLYENGPAKIMSDHLS